MKSLYYLWLFIAGLGFVAGRAIPRAESGKLQSEAETQGAPRPDPAGKQAMLAVVATAPASPGRWSLPVSTDTVESLLAIPGKDLYEPLALWLMGASSEDIARFWDAYRKRGEPPERMLDLIFMQWAKRDPQALIETARRDGDEAKAWFAWGIGDPEGALAAAKGQPGRMRRQVLQGISNFHPELALEMLKEDPSLIGCFNSWKLAEAAGKEDPAAGVELLHDLRPTYSLDGPFRRWAEQDPRAAFAWLSESRPNDEDELLRQFTSTTARDHPELLAELAAGLPAGATRHCLEAAYFAHVAEHDPGKALEEARGIDSPRLAAERFALLGKALVEAKQPERALAVLKEMLAKCPDAAMRNFPRPDPMDGSGSMNAVAGVGPLLLGLAGWNPAQTMAVAQEAGVAEGLGPVAAMWVTSDPAGFAEWTEAQQDPKLGNLGAKLLADQLKARGDYAASLEWSLRMSTRSERFDSIATGYKAWAVADRDAALQWLEGADLPEKLTQDLRAKTPGQEQGEEP